MPASYLDKHRGSDSDTFRNKTSVLVRESVHDIIGIHNLSVISGRVKPIQGGMEASAA